MNLDNLNTGAPEPSAGASAAATPEPAPVAAHPAKMQSSSGKPANPK
jgi:hypothetical protein